DIAVSAHQHDGRFADDARECCTKLGVADQHVGRRTTGFADLEDRDASAEKRAHMVNGPQRDFGHSKGNNRRRMPMYDRLDLGVWIAVLTVNEARDVEGAPALLERVGLEVKLQNGGGHHETRRHAASKQESGRVLSVPGADMPEAVDHALVGKDAVSGYEIFDLRPVRHLLRPLVLDFNIPQNGHGACKIDTPWSEGFDSG